MAARKSEVIITCDSKSAQAAIEALNRELQKSLREREQLLQIQKQNGSLTKDQAARDRELKKYIESLTSVQQRNTEEMRKYGQVMKDLTGSKTKDLKRALGEVKRALDNMSAKDPKRDKLVADMKRIQAQIDANTGAIKRQQGALASLGTTLKNLVAYAGVFAGFNKLKSMIEGVFKANLQLSDSLADIRKVSGLTFEEINKLYTKISKIDTRNTIETLNKLAYAGAKLGIQEHGGVEALTGFVRAAEQVQMALGEDLGEEALPALAKLTEVMGLINKYGVEQSMQKAASAIFQLSTTSTSTGKNIVEFSKRLMGLANVSRISADELLAIGSAADAMGLMPEVAATTFNKLFTSIQKNHNLLEKSLGLVKGSINENFTKGQTIKTIVDIFESMNKRGNMNALDTIFKDLGSDGARLVAVMTTMADRVDILKTHLATSTKAFKDGTAVINEYMIQNETAAALMERASNIWAKAFTNPEGVDMVKQLAQEWYDLSKEMTQNTTIMWSLKKAIEGVALALKTIIQLSPLLINALAFAGILTTVRGIYFGILSLITAIRTASTAAMTFNAVIKSNLVIAAISAIAGGIALWCEHLHAAAEEAERAEQRQAELNEQLLKSRDNIQAAAAPLQAYKKALDNSNKSLDERNKLLKDLLKSDYQDYLDYLGIEIDGAIDLAKAYALVVKTLKQKKAYEEREQYRDEVNQGNKMERMRAGMQFSQSAKLLGANLDESWLRQRHNLTPEAVFSQVVKAAGGSEKFVKFANGVSGWIYYDKHGNVIDKAVRERIKNNISSYSRARNTENITNRDVNMLYSEDVGDFDNDKFQEEVLKAQLKRKGNLSNLKPDKDALKKAKQAAAERKQAMRKELQDAERESDAIMSKIEEWYRLQEAVITGYAADGVWTQEKADQIIAQLNIAKNKALADARRGISGRDEKSWEVTKQRIGTLMFDTSDMSKHLLESILEVKLENVRTALGNIDKAGIEGITSTAMRDKLNKNAAGNDREIQRILRRASKEVEQMLLQYDFLEQAIRSFDTRLEKLGLLTESAATAARRINSMEGTDQQKADAEAAANAQRRDAKQQAALSFISNGVDNFKVDYNDTAALTKWLREFTSAQLTEEDYLMQRTPGFAKWAEVFKEDFQLWLNDSEHYKQDIQAFYLSLVNAEEIYYKKRKESFEFYKQQQDQTNRATGRTDSEDRQIDVLSNRSKQQDTGIGATFWQQQGLGTIANDPEVQMIQTRIYYRNLDLQDAQKRLDQMKQMQDKEIADMQAAGATKEAIEARKKQMTQERMGLEDLVHEREKAKLEQEQLLATKVAQEMQKRIQTINSLVKPVETAAKSIGQKFGDMIFDMESEESTWEEIWKNMALAVAESMLSMLGQYAQNTIARSAMNKAEETEEGTHATVMAMMGISEGASKTIGTLGWLGIALIPVITALLMGLLSSALSSQRGNKTKPKTKLSTGMLTYDEGNVQTVVGDDGHVYHARTQQQLPDGVSVVRHPIATTVNGQQALVGERGPEIVIGRRTTRNIQMNRPDLLRQLALIDRGITTRRVRTFDEGNISDLARAITTADAPATDAAATPDEERAAMMQQMQQMQQVMQGVLHYLQNPVAPNINMYGSEGLHSKMKQADAFMRQYSD